MSCAFYEDNDYKTVYNSAKDRFKDWTKADNDRLFKADASVPWIGEQSVAVL